MKKMRVKFADRFFKRKKNVYTNNELDIFAHTLNFDLYHCFGEVKTFEELLHSFELSTNDADYRGSYSKFYMGKDGDDMLVELVLTETKNLPYVSNYECLFSIGRKTYAMFIYEDL
jgi:hypothetical protein